MNKKQIAIAAVLLLAAVAVVAQPLAPPAPPPPGARAALVLGKFLELTPDQVSAWKQIHTDTAATLKPLLEQRRTTQKDLAAALDAATPDPVSVGKLSIALHQVNEQIRAAHEATQTKLRDTLTPDQQVKFDAFQAAVKAQRKARL